MSEQQDMRLVGALRWASRIQALVALGLGATVFAGWAVGQYWLRASQPGPPTMKANTALCIMLASVALLLAGLPRRSRAVKVVGGTLCGLTALLGLLTLAEYLFDVDLGIDQLVLRTPQEPFPELPYAGRMAPNTALCCVLMGVSVLLIDLRTRVQGWPAQYLAFLCEVLALLAFASFVYGVGDFGGVVRYARMSEVTAVSVILLSTGILFARPDRGLMEVMTSRGLGGLLARRLIVPALVLPFVIGRVARWGYHRQLYESAVSAGLITVGNIVLFTALIWAAAFALRKQEELNRRAEEAGRVALLKEQEARAEALAEQQARSRAEAAEREAAATAAENARLYQEARQAVRTREEVLAVVSHDLKTPLGTIALSASLLRRLRVPAELEPKLHKHADTIARSVERMNGLIGDLLDMASLRAGQLVLDERPWPVEELVGDVLAQFEPQAMHKRLELGAGLQAVGGAWVRCDRRRVFQVMANLVGNAIKFTPEHGSVRLEVEPAGDRLRFLVRDTGPGIAPEHLPHLFDPFWQAKETARHGTGLGLPIARALVAVHGGELTVESRQGEGSTFTFTLPRAEPEDARSAPPPDNPKTH